HGLHRFSNRQQQRHRLQGLLGQITLAGDLEPFLPLLQSAEILHVGKNATMGLGRVEVGW
ncbi:MAG: CRISPR system precrRNA processing endoribonuclease RAMP protein Cas6, partial [Acidobacteria bacterium]|nr:CRISPR system precrRNA processing endoribonuclease RAMP protein Cas6 [Acidobacteriota bacterium]